MYTHLIISGGGIKGAAMIGALHVIKNLEHIHTFAGSSVGGLICLLLAVGYTPNDLYHMLLDIDFQEYIDYNFIDFFDNIGIVNGDRFINLIEDLLRNKGIDKDITFDKLYQLTGNSIVLTGSNLSKERIEYFGRETTPDMKVLIATRITISYPLFFTPAYYNDDMYADGGLYEPYPINLFPEAKKIGILVDAERVYNPNYKANNIINGFEQYICIMIKTMMARYIKLSCNNMFENTITIDLSHISSINLAINREDKIKMYQIGIDEAHKFYALRETEGVT